MTFKSYRCNIDGAKEMNQNAGFLFVSCQSKRRVPRRNEEKWQIEEGEEQLFRFEEERESTDFLKWRQ